tara:strand:- start:38 stop:247 length:210 start_codon:yes stop_codon:yes gene_type:complete
MKVEKNLVFSFVAPFMIFLSIVGLISKKSDKKIFYLPIGFMGIIIILEREVSRKLKRKNILKKINSFKK